MIIVYRGIPLQYHMYHLMNLIDGLKGRILLIWDNTYTEFYDFPGNPEGWGHHKIQYRSYLNLIVFFPRDHLYSSLTDTYDIVKVYLYRQ